MPRLVVADRWAIAKRCGVAPRTVEKWMRYPDFPRPLAKLRIGTVWRWDEVREWAIRHSRYTPDDWISRQWRRPMNGEPCPTHGIRLVVRGKRAYHSLPGGEVCEFLIVEPPKAEALDDSA